MRTMSPTFAWLLLVVRVELGAPPDDLLVPRVRLHDVDLDDDRLLHRVGDDGALALLAPAALVLGLLEPDDRLPLGRCRASAASAWGAASGAAACASASGRTAARAQPRPRRPRTASAAGALGGRLLGGLLAPRLGLGDGLLGGLGDRLLLRPAPRRPSSPRPRLGGRLRDRLVGAPPRPPRGGLVGRLVLGLVLVLSHSRLRHSFLAHTSRRPARSGSSGCGRSRASPGCRRALDSRRRSPPGSGA